MPPESSGYIQVPGNPVLSSQAATYCKANVERIIEFTAASKLFKSSRDPSTALSIYRKARRIYAALESHAPAARHVDEGHRAGP